MEQPTIQQDISAICTYMYTKVEGKKHGAWNYYIDDKVQLGYDTYYPNMHASIKQGGKWVDVFSASGHGHVYRFNNGAWVDYVHTLAEKAQAKKATEDAEREAQANTERSRNFGVIDDAATFAPTSPQERFSSGQDASVEALHTALPWRISCARNSVKVDGFRVDTLEIESDASAEWIAQVLDRGTANAELIVTAVNERAALLNIRASAQRALELFDYAPSTDLDAFMDADLRAALTTTK